MFQTCMAYFCLSFHIKGECTSRSFQYNSTLCFRQALNNMRMTYSLFLARIVCFIYYLQLFYSILCLHWYTLIWIELNCVCVSKGGRTEGRERRQRRACHHWTRKCHLLYDTYILLFKGLGAIFNIFSKEVSPFTSISDFFLKWFGILTTLYWHKPKEGVQVWSCIYCIFRSLSHPSNFAVRAA